MDEDNSFPDFPDAPDAEADPTARGIVQCLRMLADEAASLGMAQTLDALQTAIRVCAEEARASELRNEADESDLSAPAGVSLH